jgi:hypothetical protein
MTYELNFSLCSSIIVPEIFFLWLLFSQLKAFKRDLFTCDHTLRLYACVPHLMGYENRLLRTSA